MSSDTVYASQQPTRSAPVITNHTCTCINSLTQILVTIRIDLIVIHKDLHSSFHKKKNADHFNPLLCHNICQLLMHVMIMLSTVKAELRKTDLRIHDDSGTFCHASKQEVCIMSGKTCNTIRCSIIHIEIANKMRQFIKIYYSMFIRSSTCFGRHTVHHQELKTALAVSGFAYVKDCWTLRLLDADSVQQPQRPTTSHVCKTRDC